MEKKGPSYNLEVGWRRLLQKEEESEMQKKNCKPVVLQNQELMRF